MEVLQNLNKYEDESTYIDMYKKKHHRSNHLHQPPKPKFKVLAVTEPSQSAQV